MGGAWTVDGLAGGRLFQVPAQILKDLLLALLDLMDDPPPRCSYFRSR
jgi:hypothetical protein